MDEAINQYRDVIWALERDNSSVHDSLRAMRSHAGVPSGTTPPRRRAESYEDMHFKIAYSVQAHWSIIPLILFLVGFIALVFVIVPPIIKFILAHWKTTLLCIGTASVGAGLALALGRIGFRPLQRLTAPDPNSNEPLRELQDLAQRTAQRLKTAYRIQVSLLVAVFTGFAAVVAWTIALVSQKRISYASAFGSGSVAMLILSKWKWQPFDRMAEARRLADQADVLATALRLRMRTIHEIKDPEVRSKAQWKAAADFLKLS